MQLLMYGLVIIGNSFFLSFKIFKLRKRLNETFIKCFCVTLILSAITFSFYKLNSIEVAMIRSVKASDFDKVQDILKNNPNIASYTNYWYSHPLAYAASADDLEIFKLLVSNGADINYQVILRNGNISSFKDIAEAQQSLKVLNYITNYQPKSP